MEVEMLESLLPRMLLEDWTFGGRIGSRLVAKEPDFAGGRSALVELIASTARIADYNLPESYSQHFLPF